MINGNLLVEHVQGKNTPVYVGELNNLLVADVAD